MTAQMGFGGNAEFVARLDRIKAGGLGTNHTIFVGVDEKFPKPPRSKQGSAKPKPLTASSGSSSRAISAFALGLPAVLLAQYLGFAAKPDAALQTDWLQTFGLSLGIGVGLAFLFKLRGKLCALALGISLIFGTCSFHNLVHWFPQTFEMVFSADWVLTVLTTTEPNSLRFRDSSFTIDS